MKTIREYCEEIDNAIMAWREKGFHDNCILPILPQYMAESKNALFILLTVLYQGYGGVLPSTIDEIVREMLYAVQPALLQHGHWVDKPGLVALIENYADKCEEFGDYQSQANAEECCKARDALYEAIDKLYDALNYGAMMEGER